MMYNKLMIVMALFAGFSAIKGNFPNIRCNVPTCEATPYDLTWVSESLPDASGKVTACFKITSKPCIDDTYSKYGCCNTLSKQLYKILLSTRPECEKSVKAVYVNNILKGGGVYFDKYSGQSELRLTNLNMQGNTVPGTMVCLSLDSPCASIEDFCVESSSQLCKFSIINQGNQQCCPTCYMLDKSWMTANTTVPPSNNTQTNQTSTKDVQVDNVCLDCCKKCTCS